MTDLSGLKPGDRAMLSTRRVGNRTGEELKAVTVTKVYKNGLIIVDGSIQKYRQDGTEAGAQRSAWGPITTTLKLWDDTAWAEYEVRMARVKKARLLEALVVSLQRTARDDVEAAARIWDALPRDIAKMWDASPQRIVAMAMSLEGSADE